MKHIFIVNSISGKGQALKLVPLINEIIDELKLDAKIYQTNHQYHAYEIAKSFNNMKDITLYVVGGDGTIFEVLNGMSEDNIMAIIPSGSGNDFYRIFNHDIKDYKKLIIDTINGITTRIDYGMANGRKFLNTTSLGIDADIAYDASKMIRKTFITKGPAYVLSILKNVIIPKSKKLKIIYDNTLKEDEYYITCIMNGQYYGNGAHSAPNSKLNDGYLDFIIAKKCFIFKVYFLLGKYLNGKHINDRHFEIIKAKHIHIESNDMMPIQSDGEYIESKSLDINIIKKGLLFKVPEYYINKL